MRSCSRSPPRVPLCWCVSGPAAGRRPPVLAQLPDGLFLSVLAGLQVRIIDAEVIVMLADGRRVQGRYRLVITTAPTPPNS